MKQKNSGTKAIMRTLAVGLLFATATTGAASHDPLHHPIDPVDHDFRASHPFRVYVDTDRARSSRRHEPGSHYVRERLRRLLPHNIILVADRRDADMTVGARLIDYHLNFHVTDVDRRNKKYKKKYRYTPGRCGYHKRAFYTRVTEKGVALADYQLTYRLRGDGTYTDALRIQAAESYRYGKDLAALTNCGVAPSSNYPNSTVARLFSQADGRYRDTLAHEIRTEGLRNLAHALAGKIRARADQYYIGLAARIHRHEPVEYGLEPGADVYDFDDVDRQPRRVPAGWRRVFGW